MEHYVSADGLRHLTMRDVMAYNDILDSVEDHRRREQERITARTRK